MNLQADQLRRIRNLAKHRLQELSGGDQLPTESYIFENDRFCGVRFRHGLFYAQWMLTDDLIKFFRESEVVDQLRLNDLVRRAA